MRKISAEPVHHFHVIPSSPRGRKKDSNDMLLRRFRDMHHHMMSSSADLCRRHSTVSSSKDGIWHLSGSG